MDSHQHQAATKQGLKNVETLQHQDELLAGGEYVKNSHNKRMKLETNPMKIGNIVEKVLSFVNVKTVKELRAVSKLWSSEGAKILFKRCYVSISWDHQTLLLEKFLGKTRTEDEEFEDFLAHRSSDVPNIPNIAVQRDCDFTVWKSLGVLGPQVNYLKLTYIDDQAELLHKLLNLLPNLQYLNLEGMSSPNFWANDEHVFRVLRSVMSKAPESRGPLVVSSMYLLLENEEELKELEKLSDCSNIKFEKLKVEAIPDDICDLPTFEAQIIDVLGKLLSASQDILKSLILDGCEFYLSRLEFPCLTSLTHLDFIFHEVSVFKFWPSFRFTENVPNLVELGITYEEGDPDVDVFQALFENTETVPSVKRLRLDYNNDDTEDDTIEHLFQVFPNIEELEAFRIYLSKEALHSLWNQGKKLKKLGIHFQLDANGVYDDDPDALDLDSIITGFDPETVNNLKDKVKSDRGFSVNAEELRIYPSILNLKELEVLTIHLEGYCFEREDLLALAGQYAFKYMPSNARIIIDFQCEGDVHVLDQVSKLPNVTII